ncbi:MAG: CCA tRNA nucleotidyltransferase [Actinomycetota bacterium]|nr:MAG: CCA tRNA nucleotidyltransferase [Actinomycetota bacterium]
MTVDRFQRVINISKPLAELFIANGKKLYLVGGAVRDLFVDGGVVPETVSGASDLDDPKYDLDFTTDALPAEIEKIVVGRAEAMWLQGKRFGTVGVAMGGYRFEITTHRAEVYHSHSRKPKVTYSEDIQEDLSRRDFTINAMALSLHTENPEMVDPFGGLDDLANRRLVTPLSPEISFSEDPLRMLRAARFIARMSVDPAPELVEAVCGMHDRLKIVSAERIRDEFDKLLTAKTPSPGLEFLVTTGLAQEFIPELPALELEQDPIHRHKDVLAHTIAVVDKTSPDRILRLSALFHDVGKPATKIITPQGVTFHHHDVVGARMARERMRALKYSVQDIADVSDLVFLHLRFHTYQAGWTDSAVRRYVRDAGPLLDRLNELTLCDSTTRNQSKVLALRERMEDLKARIAQLREKEELGAIRPEINGDEVMKLLEVPPSPLVGEALDFLLEIRLEEGLIGKDRARERLLSWWQEKRS